MCVTADVSAPETAIRPSGSRRACRLGFSRSGRL